MKFINYIKKREESKSKKYRTINLDEDLHLFFKRTANHYDITMADLMYNILADWKHKHEKDIAKDVTSGFVNK